MPADGTNSVQDVDRSLGEVVNRISENASTLVREEIELAKAEIELKVQKLARGAAVGAAAGFFVFLGLIFAFHALSWGLSDIFGEPYGWIGYLITTVLLFVLAGIAGLIAMRSLKAGAPPTPDRAIEEAKLTREVIEHPELQPMVTAAELEKQKQEK
ncbi:MAG TPA: phage holin family protein [Solirubrobacterales bacterium]|nr:phage holin family protein [Solirubrobacterales bacterium]